MWRQTYTWTQVSRQDLRISVGKLWDRFQYSTRILQRWNPNQIYFDFKLRLQIFNFKRHEKIDQHQVPESREGVRLNTQGLSQPKQQDRTHLEDYSSYQNVVNTSNKEPQHGFVLGYRLENVDLRGGFVPDSWSHRVSGPSMRISEDNSLPGDWSNP